LQSDILHDASRTEILPLTGESLPALNAMADDLRARGAALLDADAMPDDRRTLTLTADLRYRGQAFELMVLVPDGVADEATLITLRERFEALHRQRFSFDDPKEAVELITLRLVATGHLNDGAAPPAFAARPARPRQTRAVHVDGKWQDIPVLQQDSLTPGSEITGPAVIEQVYTTMLLTGGWTLTVTPTGDLIARHTAGKSQ